MRGPWQATVVSSETGAANKSFKTAVESDWGSELGTGFFGVVRYERKFNRPTGLVPNQQVSIVVTEVDFFAECRLNDQDLGSFTFGDSGSSFQVAGLLKDFNHLIIDVRLSKEDQQHPSRADRRELPGGLIGTVYLEIENEGSTE